MGIAGANGHVVKAACVLHPTGLKLKRVGGAAVRFPPVPLAEPSPPQHPQISVKLKAENVDIAYPPVFQSGGK